MDRRAAEGAPRRAAGPEHVHVTRMVPRRIDELADGGSLYWVIKGTVQARQRLLDIRPFMDDDGIGRCRLVLEPRLVRTEWQPGGPSRAGGTSIPRMRRATSSRGGETTCRRRSAPNSQRSACAKARDARLQFNSAPNRQICANLVS